MRLRSDMFEAIMRREIGYFDREENAVGILTTRLSDDSRIVTKATGEALAKQLQVTKLYPHTELIFFLKSLYNVLLLGYIYSSHWSRNRFISKLEGSFGCSRNISIEYCCKCDSDASDRWSAVRQLLRIWGTSGYNRLCFHSYANRCGIFASV